MNKPTPKTECVVWVKKDERREWVPQITLPSYQAACEYVESHGHYQSDRGITWKIEAA
jgi:hypothetical protein